VELRSAAARSCAARSLVETVKMMHNSSQNLLEMLPGRTPGRREKTLSVQGSLPGPELDSVSRQWPTLVGNMLDSRATTGQKLSRNLSVNWTKVELMGGYSFTA
jgi:hypothetical protein